MVWVEVNVVVGDKVGSLVLAFRAVSECVEMLGTLGIVLWVDLLRSSLGLGGPKFGSWAAFVVCSVRESYVQCPQQTSTIRSILKLSFHVHISETWSIWHIYSNGEEICLKLYCPAVIVCRLHGSFQPIQLQILEFIAWPIPRQILIKEYKANTFLSEAIYVKLYPF